MCDIGEEEELRAKASDGLRPDCHLSGGLISAKFCIDEAQLADDAIAVVGQGI